MRAELQRERENCIGRWTGYAEIRAMNRPARAPELTRLHAAAERSPAPESPASARGPGLPMPHSRTFAPAIVPCALSTPAAFRHPGCAGAKPGSQGTGNPSRITQWVRSRAAFSGGGGLGARLQLLLKSSCVPVFMMPSGFFTEPLPTGVTEIEPQRPRRVVEAGCISIIQALEQILHVFEVIDVGGRTVRVLAAAFLVVDRGKHFDLHDMTHIRGRVDRPLADVARVMEHHTLRVGLSRCGRFRTGPTAAVRHRQCRCGLLSVTATCGQGKS